MEPALTFGLTHIALLVKRMDVSIHFYQQVLDMVLTHRHKNFAQLETPGARDVLVLEQGLDAGTTGHLLHFGFRLKKPEDIGMIRERVLREGGKIKEEGAFTPEEPYLFFYDPDGYIVEVWYE